MYSSLSESALCRSDQEQRLLIGFLAEKTEKIWGASKSQFKKVSFFSLVFFSKSKLTFGGACQNQTQIAQSLKEADRFSPWLVCQISFRKRLVASLSDLLWRILKTREWWRNRQDGITVPKLAWNFSNVKRPGHVYICRIRFLCMFFIYAEAAIGPSWRVNRQFGAFRSTS